MGDGLGLAGTLGLGLELAAGGAVGCRAWILAWNWAGISYTFNANLKLMKMQF